MKKLKKSFLHSQKGITSALAALIGVAMMLTFAAVVKRLQSSSFHNVILTDKEKAIEIAEAGTQAAITLLRENPQLASLEAQIPGLTNPGVADQNTDYFLMSDASPDPWDDGVKVIEDGKVVGAYFTFGKEDLYPEVFETPVFHIVTEAWTIKNHNSPQEEQSDHVRLHTFVKLANVSGYFAAIKGDLRINGGSDLRNADIYGRNVIFINTYTQANPTRVRQAEYEVAYFDNPLPDTGEIFIDGGTPDYIGMTNLPVQRATPLVFPSVDDDILYYSSLGPPAEPTPVVCDFQNGGTLADTELYIPARETDITSIDPTKPMHADPNYPYYYCPGIVDIGNVLVHGQVVIFAEEFVRITGDIQVLNDTCEDSPVNACLGPQFPGPWDFPNSGADTESKAHQLIVVAKKGARIGNNWCQNSMLDTNANLLTLQMVIIAPSDSVLGESGGACTQYDQYSLDYKGGIYLSYQPPFSSTFELNRTYAYMESLGPAPPPIRSTAQRIKEFELMVVRNESMDRVYSEPP